MLHNGAQVAVARYQTSGCGICILDRFLNLIQWLRFDLIMERWTVIFLVSCERRWRGMCYLVADFQCCLLYWRQSFFRRHTFFSSRTFCPMLFRLCIALYCTFQYTSIIYRLRNIRWHCRRTYPYVRFHFSLSNTEVIRYTVQFRIVLVIFKWTPCSLYKCLRCQNVTHTLPRPTSLIEYLHFNEKMRGKANEKF